MQPDDIPDEDVSDIDESIENVIEAVGDDPVEIENTLAMKDINEKYAEQNVEFMKEFVKLYANDPELAKASYYKEKLNINIRSEEGSKKRN